MKELFNVLEQHRNLDVLIPNKDREKLYQKLKALAGQSFYFIDNDNNIILGEDNNKKANYNSKIKLKLDNKEIGTIVISNNKKNVDDSKEKALADILTELLESKLRYKLSEALHIDTVQLSNNELKNRNKALLESENRYKQLAVELEDKVQSQVKLIEQAQRKLYTNEKLSAVGQLAAGIAHEINNPIGFISSNINTAIDYLYNICEFIEQTHEIKQSKKDNNQLQELEKQYDINFILDDFPSLMKQCLEGCKRITVIVSDLKDFSNIDGSDWEPRDMNHLLRTVINVYKEDTTNNVDIQLELNALPELECQPGFLAQAFYNIINNSISALAKQENPVITIHTEFLNETIKIIITDNGIGIPHENLNQVFVPFFTTKEIGEGTGLGLTVCRDVIDIHKGTIQVISKENVGTRVKINLPVL